MIQLDLKAKHYYLIAEILFGFAAYSSFRTLEKIKIACDGAADDDLVTVESDVNTITNVFQTLSQKPEGSFNDSNTEMYNLLLPQVNAGVNAGDPEWMQLAQNITDIRTNNFAVITASIASGKSRLFN